MTKESQPTTHNVEREAHSTCRERSETGSSPKSIEQNVCCWRLVKYLGDMEKRGGAFMAISYWSLLRSSLELATASGD